MHAKRVLIREDLNVPLDDSGKIMNEERIQRALPTIRDALKQQAAVMVVSHLGRPKEGEFDPRFSLAPVAERLSERLGRPVKLIRDWQHGVHVKPGEVVLLENVRFNKGEKENSAELAKQYARLCDVFVMDAFATAHRSHASTVGVARFAPRSVAGPLLTSELTALGKAMVKPRHPVVAIVGGAKVSTKIALLRSLLSKVDALIVGGGIANTFLKAQGVEIGCSLYEPNWVESAKKIISEAAEKKVALPLPVDVVVAKKLSKEARSALKKIDAVESDDGIFDIGPETIKRYSEYLIGAGTIIWNGPVGVFEIQPFSHGTRAIAEAIAASDAYTLAGGGDTLAALTQFGIQDKISYISTGGGAFLVYLEGGALPAVDALKEK